MKLTAKTQDIRPVASFLAGQDSMGVVRLAAAREGLVATVDRGEARWSVHCPAEVQIDGEVFLSMNRLNAFIARSPAKECTLTKNTKSLTFMTPMLKGELPVTDAPWFPPERSFEKPKKTRVNGESFLKALNFCSCAVSRSKKEYELWAYSYYINCQEHQGFVVASDHAHIASYNFECFGDPMRFCLDAGSLQAVHQWPHADYEMVSDESKTQITCDKFAVVFAQLAKNMPDIRPRMIQILATAQHAINVQTELLMIALDALSAIGANRDNFYAYIDARIDSVFIRANGEELDEVNCNLHGTSTLPIRIYFDHVRLKHAVDHYVRLKMLGEEFCLRVTDETTAIGILFDATGESFYALSPLRNPNRENK